MKNILKNVFGFSLKGGVLVFGLTLALLFLFVGNSLVAGVPLDPQIKALKWDGSPTTINTNVYYHYYNSGHNIQFLVENVHESALHVHAEFSGIGLADSYAVKQGGTNNWKFNVTWGVENGDDKDMGVYEIPVYLTVPTGEGTSMSEQIGVFVLVNINPLEGDFGLDGATTDWSTRSAEFDFTAAYKLVFEREGLGKLTIEGPVDLTDKDAIDSLIELGDHLNIASAEMSLNTAKGALEAFDGEATLEMHNLPFGDYEPSIRYIQDEGEPEFVVIGGKVKNRGKIKDYSWDNRIKKLEFKVSGWSAYEAVEYFPPVHNIDQDAYYETIQTAINAADSGDTIVVTAGSYDEEITIDKNGITLKSEEKGGAVIDMGLLVITGNEIILDGFKMRNYQVAGGGDPVIYINASDVTVQNMDLYMESFVSVQPYEIRISSESNNINILNNVVDRGFLGGHPAISVAQGADNVLIEGNHVAENGASAIAGGVGDGKTITVKNNTVYNGYDEGIWFWPVSSSGNIVVENNTVLNYSVGNSGKKAFKIVSEPASINGDGNTSDFSIYDVVFNSNPGISTVELSWLGPVYIEGKTFHNTIQNAIDSAETGDIIRVTPGTYKESVNINKNGLTLISTKGAENTNIESNTTAQEGVVAITANNVTLEGFTINNLDDNDSDDNRAIRVKDNTENTIIKDNVIINSRRGVQGNWSGNNIGNATIT